MRRFPVALVCLAGMTLASTPMMLMAATPASHAASSTRAQIKRVDAKIAAARARNQALQSQVATMEKHNAAQQEQLQQRDAEIAALQKRLQAAGAPSAATTSAGH